MNPVFFSSIISSIFSLKRYCEKCKRSQIISSDFKHKVVKCKFCGSDIPPKRTK